MGIMKETSIEMIVSGRERDLGGFSVRRVLPYATHRMVGPFIFFDHMGPAQFPEGEGLTVRPHPHVNLATVTFLFEGVIRHRDSLGSDQLIEPGAVNWMTAGRGVVHSERSPEHGRGGRLHGIQLWVALPEEHEECEPDFSHHPKTHLPEFAIEEVKLKLLLGEAFGHKSPVPLRSDLFYASADFKAGAKLAFPAAGRENAFYVVKGKIKVEGQIVEACSMLIAKSGADLKLEALEDAQVMLLGGKPVGPRHIYWNFVSSSRTRLEEAKADWLLRPGPHNPRFPSIPGDDQEFIPLPTDALNPKGTPL
jgi:redox-sensitive bicupin YhaK (pirin superfamily)